jgi:AraC family transcriptional regulator of adaptative response/methylated-DNA-[protein]-cysteine methyltransferase
MRDGRKRRGTGATIFYACVETPLGCMLAAATERGLCAVRFGEEAELRAGLRNTYPDAELVEDGGRLQPYVSALLGGLQGDGAISNLPLDIKATPFQQQVWDELRRIPVGEVRSYSAVAESIGAPKAARAVARACAANPVALVVPCHRVVRADGELGGYRWGIARKQALLAMESGQLYKT